jgi:quinol monooxygenase YgiN
VTLYFFGRFHARPGAEDGLKAAILQVLRPSREEAGCIGIHAFRSRKDSALFFIHSQWIDEAAFDLHASLAHTVRFIEAAQPLLDQPLETTRTTLIG